MLEDFIGDYLNVIEEKNNNRKEESTDSPEEEIVLKSPQCLIYDNEDITLKPAQRLTEDLKRENK